MAGRLSRRLWKTAVVGGCLVWAMASLAGGSAAGHATRPVGAMGGPSLRTLQFNLCDSGIAACYTGRSVRAAADVMRAERPDIVTLNEICRNDLATLEGAMSETEPGGTVASAFKAAVDRRTNSAYRCRNGQAYGIGILAWLRSTQGYRTYGAVYPVQDEGDPEERVWLCLQAIAGFYACTTHLASTIPIVALAQCRYLLQTAIPTMRMQGGREPMLLGADLNLTSGGSPDVRGCLTPGYHRADDGSRQYVVATSDFTVRSSKSISLHGTTDHPGLLVDLTIG